MKTLKLSIRFAAALLLAGLAGGAYAQTATTTANFNVTATVVKACSVTASPLALGNYSFAADSDGATSIVVRCTNLSPYSVSIATPTARTMTGPGGATLNYGLFADAGRSTGFAASDTGSGSDQTFNVFGRIPLGQGAAPVGNYQDTVQVTVTY
jgi:spore coat protein U-like protein